MSELHYLDTFYDMVHARLSNGLMSICHCTPPPLIDLILIIVLLTILHYRSAKSKEETSHRVRCRVISEKVEVERL